jgi:hypothetical protein
MKISRVATGQLHCIDGNELWVSRGRRLFVGPDLESLKLRAILPVNWQTKAAGSVRISRRLLRQDVHHVVRFRDRVVVVAFHRLWCLDASSGVLKGRSVPLVGGRPLAVCASPDAIFYGEYRDNAERAPVKVMGSRDGVEWSVVREIPGVRHIHGIYFDPFSGDLWLTTGDDGEECAIWRSRDSFKTLERVHFGTQQTRAIPLLFSTDHVYYGTDTPLEPNYVWRFDRQGGAPVRLHAVEGSVFHAMRAGRWLLFSTAVEPSDVNHSRDAVIYGSPDGQEWREISRHRKDALDMRFFQYGQLSFPSGDSPRGRFWYNTFAVQPDFSVFSGELDVD